MESSTTLGVIINLLLCLPRVSPAVTPRRTSIEKFDPFRIFSAHQLIPISSHIQHLNSRIILGFFAELDYGKLIPVSSNLQS